MSDELYDLALSEAIRGLEHQERSLDSYHSRAATIIAAATIATGFLAPLAWPGRGHGAREAAAAVAVVAFVGVVAAVLVVLRPRSSWGFVNDTGKFIGTYIETDEPLSVPATKRDLALHFGESYNTNEKRLEWVSYTLMAAGFALVVEMVAWLVSLFCGR